MTFIAGPAQAGYFPVQCQDEKYEAKLWARAVMYGVRIIDMNDPKEGFRVDGLRVDKTTGILSAEENPAVGDFICSLFVYAKPATRGMAGIIYGAPALMEPDPNFKPTIANLLPAGSPGSGSLASASPAQDAKIGKPGGGATRERATVGGGPTQERDAPDDGGQGTVERPILECTPVRWSTWLRDKRFYGIKLEPHAAPQGSRLDSLLPRLPGDWPGLLHAGTEEMSQQPVFVPGFAGLIAGWQEAPWSDDYSSHVFDIDDEGNLDKDRIAPLHSAWRVVRRSEFINDLAWQLGDSDRGGFGLVAGEEFARRKQVVAWLSKAKGGPVWPGTSTDKHPKTAGKDGDLYMPAHLWTGALFKMDDFRDGPIDFRREAYIPANKGGSVWETQIRWDKDADRWRLETWTDWALVDPLPEPEEEFVPKPGPRRSVPRRPGEPGDPPQDALPRPEGEFVPTPGAGRVGPLPGPLPGGGPPPEEYAPRRPFPRLATPRVAGLSKIDFRAQPQTGDPARREAPYSRNPLGSAVEWLLERAPTTLRMIGWSTEQDGVPTRIAEPDPRYGAGNEAASVGGVHMVEPAASFDGTKPAGTGTSKSFFSIGENLRFGAGTPNVGLGLTSGFSWRLNDGDVVFDSHDASAVETERFRLGNNGALEVGEITKPSNPASNKWKLYPKTDGFYQLEDDGTETALGGGGADSIAWDFSADLGTPGYYLWTSAGWSGSVAAWTSGTQANETAQIFPACTITSVIFSFETSVTNAVFKIWDDGGLVSTITVNGTTHIETISVAVAAESIIAVEYDAVGSGSTADKTIVRIVAEI